MAIAWFFAPYKRRTDSPIGPVRYCAMNDFTELIRADDGAWSECECLGNFAIVKVRASAATLTTIAGTSNFTRVPGSVSLSTSLGNLTAGQRTALRNLVLLLGYTGAEVTARFGTDLSVFTLGDLFRFVLSRRRSPRYNQQNDTIILDGVNVNCRPIEHADRDVQ